MLKTESCSLCFRAEQPQRNCQLLLEKEVFRVQEVVAAGKSRSLWLWVG